MTLHVVAIYYEDRVYGGPEEGGWWYTEGELVDVVNADAHEDHAWDLARMWNDEHDESEASGRYLGSTFPRERATVVELGREEIKPELADYVCHGDADDLWNEDGSIKPENKVVRWDVPEYYPEYRPHYC
jgi:hypothetical protein